MYITINDINDIHKYINKTVHIKCFVCNIRIHKNIAFVIIRKNHIYLQCLTKDTICIQNIRNITLESIIEIVIYITKRKDTNIRTAHKTDAYEGIIQNICVIKASSTVPFDIKVSYNNSDEIREKYRYLDLRNEYSAQCIIFRHNVISYIRHILIKRNFIEIDTPIITGSTPEGAKDFKVYGTKEGYYVLPQSPQIFKQILMLSDFTKYFQIAKCFRDENTRKNRLSCEFTQLDVEFECNTLNTLIRTTLSIVKQIFKKFTNKLLKVYKYSYTYIIQKYKSDKINILLAKKYNFCVRNNILYFQHYNIEKLSKFLKSKIHIQHIKNETYYTYDTQDYTYNEFLSVLNEDSYDMEYHCILIIYKFPYYEFKNGELTYAHNLFSKTEIYVHRQLSIDEKLKIKTLSFDCVINGQEIASGSIRSDVNSDNIKSFDFLYDIYKNFPTFEHGGFGIGIERLLSILNNDKNIKNYVPFFKLNNGESTLPRAPTVQ